MNLQQLITSFFQSISINRDFVALSTLRIYSWSTVAATSRHDQ